MVRLFHRLAAVALAAAVIVMGLGVQPAVAGAEGSLVNKVNSARSSAGKAPVQVYWDLRDDARKHARDMADQQKVFRYKGSITSGWTALGQVYGVGPSVNTTFDAFMNTYRSTILGSYNYIGVGAVTDDNGILWVSMIFMRGDEGLVDTPDDTTTTTTKPPKSTTTSKPPASTTTSTTSTTRAPKTTTPPQSTTTAAPESAAATITTIAVAQPSAITTPPTATTSAAPAATTTTLAAPVEREDTAELAAAPAPNDGGNGPLGGWMVFGFAAIAGAGLLLFGLASRGGRKTGGPIGSAVAAAFDACRNCGLVFSHGKLSACPRCATETSTG
jgi:hypothetical protein